MEKKALPVVRTIQETIAGIGANPVLLVPFLLVALSNACVLIIAYFAPRYPLSIVMAPPIRRFMGQQFLHYPQHLLVLPRLYQDGSLVVSFIGGLLATAYALFLLQQYKKGEQKIDIAAGLLLAVRNYIKMILVFTLFFFFAKVAGKGALKIVTALVSAPHAVVFISIGVDIILITLVQAIAFFIFPSFIIGGKKLVAGILEGIRLFVKYGRSVFVLVLLPTLLFIISRVIFMENGALMTVFGPGIIVASLAITIVITLCVDVFVTLFSGYAYTMVKNANDESVG